MGIEFNIAKDLATVSATLSELAAINAILCEEITAEDFQREYASLLSDILNTYEVVLATLQPLVMESAEEFTGRFDGAYQHYSQNYQSALSEPRVNAEFTFEKYLQFRKRREVGTSYPPLKRTFARLHDFIDKWIDNDIWLAMTIDTLFKALHRFLGDVAELKKGDEEEALRLYRSCIHGLPPFLLVIQSGLESVGPTVAAHGEQPATDELRVAG